MPIQAATATDKTNQSTIQKKLSELETSSNGRIGVYAISLDDNKKIQYRSEERFPFHSTVKVMVVAAILKKSMTDDTLLQQTIKYKKQDLVVWSPITEKHIDEGMTISDLCAAAIMYSDNTATNLLINNLGGTEAVTAYARSIGDNTFRLDHIEPELNSNPNDMQDTSTPAAMGVSLQQLTFGNVLASTQREQLINWMKNNTTGDKRIRAGVPKGWVVADKTGSGAYGITNDIGMIYPPKCSPIIVSLYFIQNKKDAANRDDVIASATRIVLDELVEANHCVK